MKILITGSSGFIGSELTNYLISLNQDIYTIGRKKKKFEIILPFQKKKYQNFLIKL